MSNIIRAGVDSYLLYAEEDTFKQRPTTVDQNFGLITSFTPDFNRNLNKVRGGRGNLPSSKSDATNRDAKDILKGNFEGTLDVEIAPQNFRFLKQVMGTESGSGTSADPYFYPKDSGSTIEEKKEYQQLPSITLLANNLFGGSNDSADMAIEMLGAKNDTFTLSGSQGEEVTVSMSFPFSFSDSGTTATGVAVPSAETYNFTGITVEVPNGTPVENIVRSFELSVENNASLRHGLGTDEAQDVLLGERNFELSLTADHESSEFFDDVMGIDNSGNPTVFNEVTINMTAGSTRSLTAHCLNVKIGNDNLPHNYPDPVEEGLTLQPEVVWFEEET